MRNPDAVYEATRSIKVGQPGANLLLALACHEFSRDWRTEDDKRKWALMSNDDGYTPQELKRSIKERERNFRQAQKAVDEEQKELTLWRGALKKVGNGEVEIDGEPYTRDEIVKRVTDAEESIAASIEEANDEHATLEEHRKALAAMAAGKSWPDAEELKRRAEAQ